MHSLDSGSLPLLEAPFLKGFDNADRRVRNEAENGPAFRNSGAMVGRQAAIIDEQDSIKAHSV